VRVECVTIEPHDTVAAGFLGDVQRLVGRAHQHLGSADVRVRPWYNPALRSSVYIVPGIIGVLLSLTLLAITSIAIVREREKGTFEQLVGFFEEGFAARVDAAGLGENVYEGFG